MIDEITYSILNNYLIKIENLEELASLASLYNDIPLTGLSSMTGALNPPQQYEFPILVDIHTYTTKTWYILNPLYTIEVHAYVPLKALLKPDNYPEFFI